MVNVKKKGYFLKHFVILLTFAFFYSCIAKKEHIYKIDNNLININNSFDDEKNIENYISPYRNYINNDLDSVLAYNPITQDKSKGKWQTNIGNLFATVTLQLSNPVFEKQQNKKIDFCILNHGGIRSTIPKGNITSRTAFEIMPFENSVFVIGLTGIEVKELANYILKGKKPHPLANIKIHFSSDLETVNKIEINNKLIEDDKIYYVATSDFLASGGDNMVFLKNSTIKYDLNYKIRNLFIDYFKKVDTIPNIISEQIIID